MTLKSSNMQIQDPNLGVIARDVSPEAISRQFSDIL
jgi:hypothetical protein